MTTLTLRDLDTLYEAVGLQCADARSAREEDRLLGLRMKLARMTREAADAECRCGHRRRSHAHRTEVTSTCSICRCQSFDNASETHDSGSERWEQEADAERRRAYQAGEWCGECRFGVVEDPPCCTHVTGSGV